jgi:homoserine trans-succinylase
MVWCGVVWTGRPAEQVWEVPEGAKVLASSDKTGVEMFSVDEHVLGIQGHPEYTKDILLSLVDRLLAAGFITVSASRPSPPSVMAFSHQIQIDK